MIKNIVVCCIFALFAALAPAAVGEPKAETETGPQVSHVLRLPDGRDVVLYADMTWHYRVVSDGTDGSKSVDFRSARWGWSRKQVRASETGAPSEARDGYLVWKRRVMGLPCYAMFRFLNDRLVAGKYVFLVEHTNNTDFISDYRNLVDMLTKKYGRPTDDDTFWSNDLYRDDPQEWGMAVAVGHLHLFSHWDVARTRIVAGLLGDNFEITLGVEYESIDDARAIEAHDREDESKGL